MAVTQAPIFECYVYLWTGLCLAEVAQATGRRERGPHMYEGNGEGVGMLDFWSFGAIRAINKRLVAAEARRQQQQSVIQAKNEGVLGYEDGCSYAKG